MNNVKSITPSSKCCVTCKNMYKCMVFINVFVNEGGCNGYKPKDKIIYDDLQKISKNANK